MTTRSRIHLAALAFLLIVTSLPALAQPKKARAVAREGSWVVEWTPKSRQCIVRFYNDQKQLIYEETMERSLNIARQQTKQNLNVALEQAMYVWNATHKLPTDRQWVAVQFDRK